ncbi:MAG TPA: hypothetical protein VFT22_29700 [Kofleriaceae bacterium]|nr:hypothetical protein [Kofleriaceae bacterium]
MDPIRHGAYVCLGPAHRRLRIAGEVRALADRLELRNEAEPGPDHPALAIGFLRRVSATPPPRASDAPDDALLATHAIVHLAAPSPGPLAAACAELTRLIAPADPPRILGGVVRPMSYTGNLMFNFAYAHRVLQQPAAAAPNAFLLPMSKTPAWWAKDWLERHTYLLPRYDAAGRMVSQGHALASAAGVASLMRRTYKHVEEPAPPGAYDFLTYFECTDADVSVFHEVCAALRDEARNPEWAFVREGPTWHGRRVAGWDELFE